MSLRDVLVVATSPEHDKAALSYAEQLAESSSAHLTGLVVNWMPTPPLAMDGWVVDVRWSDVVEEARGRLNDFSAVVAERLQRNVSRSTTASLLIEPEAAEAVLGLHARHRDLAIVSRPFRPDHQMERSTVIEGVLFGSGRPLIVVPPSWSGTLSFNTVVVCWNASRESARALADAMPLLEDAKRVIVITVDAKPRPEGHGDLPGVDIATHISRHVKTVEVRNLDSMGRREAKAIQDEAMSSGADLIVMGGYGRPRLSEFIFGGVTREMLQTCAIPIFMSH